MKCGPPTPVQDGFIKIANFRGEYTFGSQAIYHCNRGFILWGNSHRTCTEKGEWSGSLPTCRKVSCGDPSFIQNSAMEHLDEEESTSWNAVVTYSCLPGFTAGNGRKQQMESFHEEFCSGSLIEFQSTCQANGLWSNIDYSCKYSAEGLSSGGEVGSFFLILLIVGICLIIFTASVLLVTTCRTRKR